MFHYIIFSISRTRHQINLKTSITNAAMVILIFFVKLWIDDLTFSFKTTKYIYNRPDMPDKTQIKYFNNPIFHLL